MKRNFRIKTHTLTNNMRVVLIKNKCKEKYASVIVPVGSNVTPGTIDGFPLPEGIAHFMEHRLFDTKSGDAMIAFDKLGVYSNAETAHNYTSFYFSATNNFTEALKILLSMTLEMSFSKESIELEKPIIIEEIHGRSSKPAVLAFDQLMSDLFYENSMKKTVIGKPIDIMETTYEDLKRYYETFYQSKKMILLLIGDIDERIFADLEAMIPPGKNVRHKYISFRKQEKKEVVRKVSYVKYPVLTPLANLGFKLTKEFRDSLGFSKMEMVKAMQFLSEMFFEASSPFKEYVNKSKYKGTAINYSYLDNEGDLAFYFSFMHKDFEGVFSLILDYLRSAKNLVCEKDFNRIRKQLLGEWVINMSRSEFLYDAFIDALALKVNFVKFIECLDEVSYHRIIMLIEEIANLTPSRVIVVNRKIRRK